MKMKKTIAAIAAGAVAVSAMATTVSALEAKTLTYNLVKSVKTDSAKGTITATFTNVPLEAGGKLVIDPIAGNSWNTTVTISGSFWDDAAGTNKSFVPVVATGMDWETGYSIEGSRLWNDGDGTVEVDVVAATSAGTNVALKATSSAVLTITVKYTDLPSDKDSVGGLNGLIKDGARGIKITSLAAGANAGDNSTVTFTSGTTGGTTILFVTPDVQNAVNTAAGPNGINAEYDGSKWVQAGVAPTIKVAGFAGAAAGANAGLSVDVVDLSVITGATKPDASYTNEVMNKITSFTAAGGGDNWTDNLGGTWSLAGVLKDVTGTAIAAVANDVITINATGGVNKGSTAIAGAATAAEALKITATNGDKLAITGYAGAAAGTAVYTSPLSGAAVEASAGSEDKIPYHSTLKSNLFDNRDVFQWIAYANSDNDKDEYEIYNAVRSVVNDCVQNYNDVVFTFNTATSKVEVAEDGSWKYCEDWKSGDNIYDCTSFGRHYWDRDTGYDTNTIYIGNDWLGNNLFEGALIVNSNLTLSLGATDKFDWTATSLSFSWDSIQDAALTQNQYANYIHNMVLRTSTTWFWDNMTVTLGETETEDLGEGAPVEGDTEDLPEDEEDDFGFEEDEEEYEEPAVDVEPEPEPEPVAVATNPGTGNAPVALAVIPVALAAAAVVAKKRG